MHSFLDPEQTYLHNFLVITNLNLSIGRVLQHLRKLYTVMFIIKFLYYKIQCKYVLIYNNTKTNIHAIEKYLYIQF